MSVDPYVYPGSSVLKNKLDIRSALAFASVERQLVVQRAREGAPRGDFDLAHLRAIHRHLFQDIFDWAGEVRTVEISKAGNQFQLCRYIEIGMADVHRRIVSSGYLRGLPVKAFAGEAGRILGDVNYVHPFREGNGRTQLQYLKQLAERAGHRLDLRRLKPESWLVASREAHQARYHALAEAIAAAIRPPEG
jgi:cell filamentation protein